MIKHRCFYSFHYKPDCQRAAQVRSIGAIEGNSPASDNDWETVSKGGEDAIKRWINAQMKGRSCVVVLVGKDTAGRKWVNYEIEQGWASGKGVVGIRIHGLKNLYGLTTSSGKNPFDDFTVGQGAAQRKLSAVVNCFDPPGATSQAKYKWIKDNLAAAIDQAVGIRKKYPA